MLFKKLFHFKSLKKALISVVMVLLCTGAWGATYRWNASVTDGNWTDTNWEKESTPGNYSATTDKPTASDTVYIGVSSDTKITIPAGETATAKYVYTNSDDSETANLTLDIKGTLTVTALYTNTGKSNSGNTTINIDGTLTTLGSPDLTGWSSTPSGIFTNSSYKDDTVSNSTGNTIINVNTDTTITNLYVKCLNPNIPNQAGGITTINTGSEKKLTILGHVEMNSTSNSVSNTTLNIHGNGEVSCKIYNPAVKASHKQTIDISSNATFSIEDLYYGDAESADISPFTGSGTLRIPASGANLNHGDICGFTYDSNLKILPIGEPDLYTVSFSGLGSFPTLAITITITRKNSGGTAAIYYPYEVTAFKNTASGTFSLDKDYSTAKASRTGTTLANSTSGYLYIAGDKTSETITLSYSGTINGGDGFKLDVYTPDSARILSTLEWYSGKLTWTGETSVYWDETSNWIGLDLGGGKTLADNLDGKDLTINASATRKPEIRTGAYSLNSLTIAPNASITISGGELTVPTFTVASTGNKASVTQSGGTIKVKTLAINGNSTFTATDGTLEVTDAASTIDVGANNNLNLYNVSVPGGTGLTVTTNGSDGKLSASGEITVEGSITAANGIDIKTGGTLLAKADNFNSSPIINNGTISLYTNVSTFGTLTNATDATIHVDANSITLPATWTDFNGGNLVINTDCTGAKLGIAITNLNTLEIKSGAELSLETFDISPAKIINNGTLDIKATTLTNGTYTGSGTVKIDGGTFDYSGSAVTISTLDVTTSATLKGGTNGITVTNATYNSSPSITTEGKITLPGGTIGALDVANGSTTTFTSALTTSTIAATGSLTTEGTLTSTAITIDGSLSAKNTVNASSITIETSGNLTTAAGKTINLSGNWTNNAGSSGYTYTTSGTIIFTDSATITGATNFYNFSAENLSSKTLTIDSAIKINGTLKLSGASYSNPLTIDGTGTLTLATSQTGGKFLVVTNVGRISTATTTYTAVASRSTNDPIPAGWIFINKYKWNGTGTNWNNASSWDINTDGNNYSQADSYPQYSEDEVIIDNTSTNVAKLPSNLTLKSVTVNANSTLDLLGYNLTVPAITNNGTIKLYGTQTITTSAGGAVSLTNGTDSTIEYYGGTLATPITISNFFTKSFEKLKVNQYSTLQLGTTSLSATSLENEGTIHIDDTGTINQTDNDSGLFIYSGTAAVKNYNADGTADYYDLQLSANYTTPANVELKIANKLTIDNGKITTLGGNLIADTIENNGKIVCGAKNLDFNDYSGTSDEITATTGTITLQNATAATIISKLTLNGGSFTNNSTSAAVTISTLTPGSTESTIAGGTGTAATTISSALTTGKIKTQGNVTAQGALTGLNIDSGTFTASGNISLSGTGAYLTVTGTLDLASKDLVLTGTAADLLEVTGNGSISNLTNQINGKYISVDTSSTTTCPVITGGIYTATYSSTAKDEPVNGWNILSDALVYVWNGSDSTDPTLLTVAANWNTNIAPSSVTGTSDSILIPELTAASPKYPKLTTDVEFVNVTIKENAEFDFDAFSLTTTGKFTNNGKIKFAGTSNKIDSATKAYGASNTIEYSGTANAVTGSGAPVATDYKNLTIVSGAELSLNAQSITVGGTLSNDGTIIVNDTGVFNIAASGTADSDSGLVKYSSTTATTTTIPNINFYDLEIAAGTWTDSQVGVTPVGLSVTNELKVSGGSLTANGAITAKDVTLTDGTSTFNGNLTVTGTLTTNGPNTPSIPTVNFNNGIGGQTSSVSTAKFNDGTISFGNHKDDKFQVTGTDEILTLSSTPTFTIAGELSAAKEIDIQNNLTAAANTDFKSPVELKSDCTITNSTNQITFTNTVNGNFDLVISDAGSVSLNDNIGATTALKILNISGPVTLNTTARSVKTSANQTYGNTLTITNNDTDVNFEGTDITVKNATTLGDNTTFTVSVSGTASFDQTASTINGAKKLKIDGNALFAGTIGNTTPLSKLEVTGNTDIQTATIEVDSTSGTQTYNGNIIIYQDTTLTGKTIFTTGGTAATPNQISGNPGNTFTLTITGDYSNSGYSTNNLETSVSNDFTNSGTFTAKEDITVSGNASNTASATIDTGKKLKLAGNFNDTGTWAGTILLNGISTATAQTFTAVSTTAYSVEIEKPASSTAQFLNEITFANLTTSSANANSVVEFNANATFNSNTEFTPKVEISKKSAGVAAAGTITLDAGTKTLSFAPLNLSSSTEIKASEITFKNNVTNANSSYINLAGTLKTTGTSQTIAPNTMLDGSFTGTNNPTFQESLFIYTSSATPAQIEINSVTITKDLVFDANRTINTKGTILADNIALYRGALTAAANSTLKALNDVVLLGQSAKYSSAAADKYQQPRLSAINYLTTKTDFTEDAFMADGTTKLSKPANINGSYTVATSSVIHAGKNFYANGVTMSGAAEWFIDIPDVTNGTNGFAEAYNCTPTHSTIRCHADSSANGTKARMPAYACTDDSPSTNKNWIFDDFEISEAFTVRDNSIYVKFNRPIRNTNGELSTQIGNLKHSTEAGTISYASFHTDPDCTNTNKLTSINSQEVYLHSSDTWNTDATGTSTGASYSTDRNGQKNKTKPDIIISQDPDTNKICDAWGKRLKNYTFTDVQDYTGPVLYSVKTGQELHTVSDGTAASQHSYDAHNFLEFRYSEPVNFGSSDLSKCDINIPAYTAPGVPNDSVENIAVSDKFGALSDSIESEGPLTFVGLGKIANGKIYTGSNGSSNKYVNALYRTDEYSIRISIAGLTNGTVTDRNGKSYKKWTGYIESAIVPSGNVTMLSPTNVLVTDCALALDGSAHNNMQEEYATGSKVIPKVNHDTAGNLYPETDVYGTWDISEPIFAPYRISVRDEWKSSLISNQFQAEAIGNTSGGGSTLDRIELHFFDNTPSFDSNDKAEWVSEIGWIKRGGSETKADLYDSSYSYTADIIGGARGFEKPDNARRTTGGIRYSSIVNEASAFKYSDSLGSTPTSNFQNSKIYTGVNGYVFTGTNSPRRSAPELDSLYYGIPLGTTSYSINQTFTVKYDSSNSYITDLAGNRLRDSSFTTIDRTPPSFNLTISPLHKDELYVTFVKELVTDSKNIIYIDNNTDVRVDVFAKSGTFEQLIPSCFKLISIDSNGIPTDSTDLKIDTTKPAKVISRGQKVDERFTCIKLFLNREVTLDDVETLYLSLVNPTGYDLKSRDPKTSQKDSLVTLIQDKNRNYMEIYSAHALSDFAVNTINLLYGYDENLLIDDPDLYDGLYKTGSWAVHDWSADQNNFGTLPGEHNLAFVAETTDGTAANTNQPLKFRMFYTNNPDSNSVSTQYNADFAQNLRIWAPDVTNKVFAPIASTNNTNYSTLENTLIDDTDPSAGIIFHIPDTITKTWKSVDQISFLFGILDNSNNLINIIHTPELDLTSATPKYLPTSTKMPLYALRLSNPEDISSIDLWSFKLRTQTQQRGGVSILNNVINPTEGEKVVINVNNSSQGKVNIIVMTLDGNVVSYINRGELSQGEHYFTWDGKTNKGKFVSRGLYFVRILGNGFDETRKIMVVK